MSKMTLEKLSNQDTQSLDIRAENIAKLKSLFPEILSEKGIDFTVLKQLLGEEIEEAEERYSFSWNGKAQARRLAQTPSTGTLRPCKKESKDWETTQNLFIEGDNLEVLKLLQKSYHQQVKMIYIDPPYNTGKDFIYPDDFRDNIQNYLELTGQTNDEGKKLSSNPESSGRYHTDWLNMIYPRLKLARNLLRDDGVIFISIDDNEVSNLKKVCDEIFGEDNFIANVVWQKKYAPQNDATYFSSMHDHILVYAKLAKRTKNDAQGWTLDLLPRTESQNAVYKNHDNDPRGLWRSDNLSVKTYSAKNDYPITTPNGRIVEPPESRCWVVSKERYAELVADNRIWFGSDGGNVPSLKRFLSEVQDGTVPVTWWTYQECGHNQDAKKELKDLFVNTDTEAIFDTPKPVQLITRMLQLATKSDPQAIVLDFFAGSGTTAQAVYEMNLADSGSRRYVLVQLPEPIESGSIVDLTKERIRLAGEKIRANNIELSNTNDFDLGFKVFKLDSSNIKPWDADFDTLSEDLLSANEVIKPERTQEDVLFEILLKYGLDLNLPVNAHSLAGKTVFEVGAGALLVCLDKDVTESVAEAIGQLKAKLTPAVCRVVFRDAGFADDAAKVNAVQVLKQFGIDDVKSL